MLALIGGILSDDLVNAAMVMQLYPYMSVFWIRGVNLDMGMFAHSA
jgi:hypothetical protein